MKTKIPLLLLLALLPAALLADATPVKLSTVGRSILFREGKGIRGNTGLNCGSSSEFLFNGNFTDYGYQSTAGAELVIPTTGLNGNDVDTGVPWYVTEFKVGHKGNTRYSLYYTTEAEPANILSYAKDPRTWIPISGATNIQASGIKSYPVNTVATAVKYVFDTAIHAVVTVAEVEVWGVDPAEMDCLHPSFTEWEALPGSATCTGYGEERCKCTVCGEESIRNTLPPLGHDWQAHLSRPGTSSAYGSGDVECSRCGEKIVFNVPLDLTTQGGVAADGLIQFTDLSVSSFTDGSGVGAKDLIDDDWSWDWGAYWFAATRSESEYVQYDFGTEIDLTKLEWSAPNRTVTLKFYLWDGETEEPLVEIPVVSDGSGREYQRGSMEFRGVVAKGIRLHIVDTRGVGYNGISPVGLSELHPWGTVVGAGKLDASRTRVFLY